MNNFRNDIAGLRAIAVLAVIFYHLNFRWITSGYFGVDVFFVISGFLITKHIVEDNDFSLKLFYLNRIRRIYPVLVIVLLITSLAAYFLLLKNDLYNYFKYCLASILSFSNIYFYYFLNAGYFSPDSHVIPLLHTWSLGVEEQFYILYPLLLTLCLRNINVINHIGKITLAILAFSFLCYTLSNINFSYYILFPRAFELLIGAYLAITYKKIKLISNKLILDILSIVGILCILLPMLLNNPIRLITIIPCLGTALIILIGKESSTIPIINKILSINLFVMIGLISYSMYLWHWPIIAYINYFGFKTTIIQSITIIFSTFFLSILTYYFIEVPFRYNKKFSLSKSLVIFIIAPALLMIILLFATKYFDNFPFNKITDKQYQEANTYYGKLKKSYGCIDNKEGGDILPLEKLCLIGATSRQPPDVLVVGDSHAMASVGMLDILLQNANMSAYVATLSGSPFILGENLIDWRANKPIERSEKIAELIKKNHYKYVIIGGFWNYYPQLPSINSSGYDIKPYQVFATGFFNAVQYVIDNNAIPVIIYDNPSTMQLSRYCGLSRISVHACYNLKKDIDKSQQITNQIINNIKKCFPKTILINPNNIICDKSKCYTSYKGVPFYMSDGDNSHLSFSGSSLIGELYLKKYGNPLIIHMNTLR